MRNNIKQIYKMGKLIIMNNKIPHSKELREHFLHQIANGEKLTFNSEDIRKILLKANQNLKK